MSQVRRIGVGGLTLAVVDSGRGEPVVFHPGLGYASWVWRRLVPLVCPPLRALCLDPRGTGRSDQPPGPYSVDQLADDVGSLLEALGLASAHLVGHSMGGYVAQTLAARRPGFVRSLVLVATSPGGPEAETVPPETAGAWAAAASLSPGEFARRTFPYAFRPGWPQARGRDYAEDLAERLRRPTPMDRWRDQYAACEGFLAAVEPRGPITQPTLIVHGTADRIVPVANARLLVERIPHAELWLVPDAGHNLMLEEPQRLAARILDFLT